MTSNNNTLVYMMGCMKNPKLAEPFNEADEALSFKKISVDYASAGIDYILLVAQDRKLYFLFRNEQGFATILPFLFDQKHKPKVAHANMYSMLLCMEGGYCYSLKRTNQNHYSEYPTFSTPAMHCGAAIVQSWCGLYHHFLLSGNCKIMPHNNMYRSTIGIRCG